MHQFIGILFLFIATYSVNAQTVKLSSKAEKEWFDIRAKAGIRHYETLIPELEIFLQKNKDFIPGQKLLCESYMATARYAQALSVVDLVSKKGPFPEKEWLAMKAEAHKKLRQYDEAIKALEEFKAWPHLGLSYQNVVQEKIDQITFTRNAIQNPVPYEPFNLGDSVNTPLFELYPHVTPEGKQLFFTRKDKSEDLFVAEWQDSVWGNIQPLSINTPQNEGAHTVSADGRFLFFTGCNREGGLGSCDIFYALRSGDAWTKPAGIGAPINSTDWESQPCFTANGMAMLFSSNRPNGKGGKDLYISYLDKNFKWLEPMNLGPEINTSKDEETPFLHADGRTLFFSSNGHPSVGGKDLFMSRLGNDGKWSKPLNLGYPINTEGDESGLYVLLDGKTGYLASDREGGQGSLDLYKFELHEKIRAQPATYVKAIVRHAETKQALAGQFTIAELSNNRIFAEGKCTQQGEMLICIPVNQTYSMQVEMPGFMFHSENFSAKEGSLENPYVLEIDLYPIQKGGAVVLNNVFFDYNSHELKATSFPELDKIVELLQKHSSKKAEIAGHTDDIGSADFNQTLSQKRAESVVAYLVSKGISADRLTAKGYGKSKPIAENNSEANRALNRRTELVLSGQ